MLWKVPRIDLFALDSHTHSRIWIGSKKIHMPWPRYMLFTALADTFTHAQTLLFIWLSFNVIGFPPSSRNLYWIGICDAATIIYSFSFHLVFFRVMSGLWVDRFRSSADAFVTSFGSVHSLDTNIGRDQWKIIFSHFEVISQSSELIGQLRIYIDLYDLTTHVVYPFARCWTDHKTESDLLNFYLLCWFKN